MNEMQTNKINPAAYLKKASVGPDCVMELVAWAASPQEIEEAAHLCHELNRAYCVIKGDLSQKAWDQTNDEQKELVRDGVQKHFAGELRTDQQSHDSWLEQKLRNGWRYGPIKDLSQKIHPCVLPYHALSEDDKMKDSLFRAVCMGYRMAKTEARKRL